jgi:hypothetical protein
MRHAIIIFFFLVFAVSCAGPVGIKSIYSSVGEYKPDQVYEPIVNDPSQIRIFYDSAPAGFTLVTNTLSVEEGYNHKILGTIKIDLLPGYCYKEPHITKSTVMKALQEEAYKRGGNAVIFAYSAVDETNKGGCDFSYSRSVFGFGWAVVMEQ